MEQFFIKTLSIGTIMISILIVSFLLSFITKSSGFYSNILKKYGLQIVFLFSLISMVGSLAMSSVFDFPPCDLCWYQRMFMYPIVFITGFAWYKKDFKNGAVYSIMLAIVGALIALYHYLIQISETLKTSSAFCSPTAIDCSIPDFIEFGFITTPFISLVVFILIIISSYYATKKN